MGPTHPECTAALKASTRRHNRSNDMMVVVRREYSALEKLLQYASPMLRKVCKVASAEQKSSIGTTNKCRQAW